VLGCADHLQIFERLVLLRENSNSAKLYLSPVNASQSAISTTFLLVVNKFTQLKSRNIAVDLSGSVPSVKDCVDLPPCTSIATQGAEQSHNLTVCVFEGHRGRGRGSSNRGNKRASASNPFR
jgi:hypothetical protein